MLIERLRKSAARWLQSESPEPKLPTGRHEHIHLSNPWHAVSIEAAEDGCGWAKALRGRRFLSPEAPQMPLDDCDAATCRCRYRHHDDRRSDKKAVAGNGQRPDHPLRRSTD